MDIRCCRMMRDRWLFGMFQYGAGKLLVYLVTISSSDTGIMHGF